MVSVCIWLDGDDFKRECIVDQSFESLVIITAVWGAFVLDEWHASIL